MHCWSSARCGAERRLKHGKLSAMKGKIVRLGHGTADMIALKQRAADYAQYLHLRGRFDPFGHHL